MRGEGSEQLRQASGPENLPPGSAPQSGCGPRPRRAPGSGQQLCPPAATPLPCEQRLRASAALVVGWGGLKQSPPELLSSSKSL